MKIVVWKSFEMGASLFQHRILLPLLFLLTIPGTPSITALKMSVIRTSFLLAVKKKKNPTNLNVKHTYCVRATPLVWNSILKISITKSPPPPSLLFRGAVTLKSPAYLVARQRIPTPGRLSASRNESTVCTRGYLKKILFAASLTFPTVSTQLLPARSRALWANVPALLRLDPVDGSTTSATPSQSEPQSEL